MRNRYLDKKKIWKKIMDFIKLSQISLNYRIKKKNPPPPAIAIAASSRALPRLPDKQNSWGRENEMQDGVAQFARKNAGPRRKRFSRLMLISQKRVCYCSRRAAILMTAAGSSRCPMKSVANSCQIIF